MFPEIQVETEAPAPVKTVDLGELQRLAEEAENPNAFRGDIAGFTHPQVRVDQEGLEWAPDLTDGYKFRFTGGTLKVTIHTTIYLLDTLSQCEQQFWREHEERHARDYSALDKKLLGALEKDLVLQNLFEPKNSPSAKMAQAFAGQVHDAVKNVFTSLTQDASVQRDTPAEYSRVRKEINKCQSPRQPSRGGPAIGRPTVNYGDRQRP